MTNHQELFEDLLNEKKKFKFHRVDTRKFCHRCGKSIAAGTEMPGAPYPYEHLHCSNEVHPSPPSGGVVEETTK